MMEKIIPAGSWDLGAEPTALVKVSSRGLTGEDRRSFLEKRAADTVFANLLDKVALHPGDIPIHTLAIGATEAYGPNRNGDGFNESTCRKQAHTFQSKPLCDWEKSAHNGARFYRHHKNKVPKESYGYVKLAAYNPRMRRIELLLIGNGTKEAAERNGGHVMSDSTLAKLEQHGDIPGSMACKVAYDVCQNCLNKAATRMQYCTSDTCINPHSGFRGLGCRDGLTKLASNGRIQFVENPNAIFFDWSEVARPADYIAYGGKADYMQKAASDGHIIGGAELAEMYAVENGFSYDWSGDKVAYQMKLANDLAAIEQSLETDNETFLRAFAPTMQPTVDISFLGKAGTTKLASGLKALADEQISLPLRDFLRLASDAEGEKLAHYVAMVSPHLPGIYTRMITDPDLASQIKGNSFAPGMELPSHEQRVGAMKMARDYSCRPHLVQERAQRSALRAEKVASATIPTVATDGPGEDLARRYALYKLAFLAGISADDSKLPLTSKMAVLQNYIS